MTLASTTKWRSKSPEYKAYQDAKSRCTNVNHRLWFYYGGRGIRFLFTSFDEFIGIIGTRPDNFTLDRIDNNGNYEPMNVRWASKSTQMSNRRAYKIPWREAVEKAKTYIITHPDGKKETIFNMAKFCREHNLHKGNLHSTITGKYAHKGYRAQLAQGV